MNQGVIMEVKKNYSIVLSQGNYYRISNKKNMVEGMSILFVEDDMVVNSKKMTVSKPLYRYGSVAAMMVLFLMLSMAYYNNQIAVFSVVTLDINPSIELSLNKHDQVVKVTALNEDGEDFTDMALKGLDVEDAVDALVEAADIKGYIKDEEETFIIITAVPIKDLDENRVDALKASIAENLTSKEADEITYAVLEATEDELLQAKEEDKPLPVVVMQNKNKVKELKTVKQMGNDPIAVQEIAEEGYIIRAQMGNSEENRNDLQVILRKLEGVTGPTIDLELAEEFRDALEDESLTHKERKDLGKALLDQLKPYGQSDEDASEEESEDEKFDGGALRDIQIKLLEILEDDALDEEWEEAIDKYLEDIGDDLDEKPDNYQDLVKVGQSLLKDLRENGFKHEGEVGVDDQEEGSDEKTNKGDVEKETDKEKTTGQDKNKDKTSDDDEEFEAYDQEEEVVEQEADDNDDAESDEEDTDSDDGNDKEKDKENKGNGNTSDKTNNGKGNNK